jgi:flagellin
MRVQHNIAAMNSYRTFGLNNSKLNKNLEKLSSGYKINRAGDDAAGLAVSEKMRAQITGIEGAKKNAKDGIGLIQTAEGALTEVHDMLNRMYSLAEQSANGTYDNNTDRASLEMELESLTKEIDRIGKTANYNGKDLFTSSGLLGGQITLNIGEDGKSDNQLQLFKDADWKTSETVKNIFTATKGTGQDRATSNYSTDFGETPIQKLTVDDLKIKINNADTGVDENGINILTDTNAQKSLGKIKDAITVVSAIRGQLGAYQNRLEHTVNNLGVMQENIQDAESSIRDTDVAEEMMKYTKNNIMSQASQAMLAQANQQPQGVLQLLQ